MKVLLVTGRLASEQVRRSACGTDVLVLDVDVAAFITPEMLCRAGPQGYDLILIPGAITADFRGAEMALGTSIRLGPKHAVDLISLLPRLDEVELSTTVPACVLFEAKRRQEAIIQLERQEAWAPGQLTIKGVKIGGSSRMKVLAEVVDATRLRDEDLVERIRYFEEQGADLIDLGASLDATSASVKRALKKAREVTALPISIDAVRPELICAGIEAGADMILSLNGENLPLVGSRVAEAGIPAVVIPGPGSVTLEENLNKAKDYAIQIIADPVLDPPLMGLARSMIRYISLREADPDIPLFFGVGNVTELLDGDSQGANLLLSVLAMEVGASLLFTPEYSAKAKGSIHELAVASRMMVLAKGRQTPPKDLGLDLLILKEKRRIPEEVPLRELVEASADHKFEADPAGSFRIFLSEGRIMAGNGRITVAGTSARKVLNTLIDRGLIGRLDHAGYLGRELERAEIALRLGRSYIQDEPLWPIEKG
jgi:dihydropteroate synthase-like protein